MASVLSLHCLPMVLLRICRQEWVEVTLNNIQTVNPITMTTIAINNTKNIMDPADILTSCLLEYYILQKVGFVVQVCLSSEYAGRKEVASCFSVDWIENGGKIQVRDRA